jgi:hypothetical protein
MIICEGALPCCEMSMQGLHNLRHWTMHRMDLRRVTRVSEVTACDSPTTADAGADFVKDTPRDPKSIDLSTIERTAVA